MEILQIKIIEEKRDSRIELRKHELATKDDIYRLRDDMAAMKIELKRLHGKIAF